MLNLVYTYTMQSYFIEILSHLELISINHTNRPQDHNDPPCHYLVYRQCGWLVSESQLWLPDWLIGSESVILSGYCQHILFVHTSQSRTTNIFTLYATFSHKEKNWDYDQQSKQSIKANHFWMCKSKRFFILNKYCNIGRVCSTWLADAKWYIKWNL